MSELAIRQIFEARLEAWAKQKPLCVKFENKRLPKEPQGLYLRTKLLNAPAQAADIVGEETAFVGVFSIDIMGVPDKGAKEAGEAIAALRQLFPCFEVTKTAAVSITQMTPLQVATAQEDGDHYMVPTSFQYTALG